MKMSLKKRKSNYWNYKNKKEYSKTDIQANKTWDYITKQIIDIKYSQLNNHLNLKK